jgi:hypothetical protein
MWGLDEFVAATVLPEALELRRLIVTSTDGIGQPARVGSFESLSEDLLSAKGLEIEAGQFVRAFWKPPWERDEVWSARFLEEWRRLLVRLQVAHLLINHHRVGSDDLQRAVYASTQSAAVAMLMLLDVARLHGSVNDFID